MRELKRAGPVDASKKGGHTWGRCSLAEKIQLTWFQGEDYGLLEMLSWRNDRYAQALKHNNIIVKGTGRGTVAGTFPIPRDAPGVNQAVQDISLEVAAGQTFWRQGVFNEIESSDIWPFLDAIFG